MASVERIVPIARVSDIRVALEFYCSVLGFNEDFHYRAGPEGPNYVGVSLNGHQLHLSTFAGDGKGPATIYVYVNDVDKLYAGFCARGLPKDTNRSIKHGASVRCTSETTTATRFGSAADYLKLANTNWRRRQLELAAAQPEALSCLDAYWKPRGRKTTLHTVLDERIEDHPQRAGKNS
jgi:catechol 2,3-dioxygenase-like lactoylglutathione lyase family enzyme